MFFKTVPRVKNKLSNLRGKQTSRNELMRRLKSFPGHLIDNYIRDAGEISELEEWLDENSKQEK